ncbi:MAG: hypothetical protein WBV82_20130 [Myxococcaceae bacterium]
MEKRVGVLMGGWGEGREITVGILGGEVLGSCEIAFEADTSRYFLPPRLTPTRVANIEALALAAYRALGCRGYGRVDLISSESENDVLLEVNTLPGMTPTSLFPKIAAHRGLSFESLVQKILSLAALDDVEVAPGPTLDAGPATVLPMRRAG